MRDFDDLTLDKVNELYKTLKERKKKIEEAKREYARMVLSSIKWMDLEDKYNAIMKDFYRDPEENLSRLADVLVEQMHYLEDKDYCTYETYLLHPGLSMYQFGNLRPLIKICKKELSALLKQSLNRNTGKPIDISELKWIREEYSLHY